jgi:hypothetical protein
MGHPFALDFGAVMTMGQALGADPEMLADVMPAAQAAIIAALAPDGDD